MRGLLVSATSSNQGKTVISVGLLGLLRQRLGMSKVIGAKAGPDYIDTAYLANAQGIGLSLDPWAMRPNSIKSLLAERSESHLLVEGTMGLFDGSIDQGKGSSAALAKKLGLPVVLVIDVSGMGQSVAAIADGAANFDPDIEVIGVILNRVGSARHETMLRDALDDTYIDVLGAVPRDAGLDLDSRHLGLVQAGEHLAALQAQTQWAQVLKPHLDLEAIINGMKPTKLGKGKKSVIVPVKGKRVAIADDAAFRFCYGHWRRPDAVTFSPLANQPIPTDVDFVFLPGGYPELHLPQLAKADQFWRSLQNVADAGVPVYGECGGYMVLGHRIQDAEGNWFDGAGLLPLSTSFASRKRQLGYRNIELLQDTSLGTKGQSFKGHEFHYSTVVDQEPPDLFRASDARGENVQLHGHNRGAVSGSYLHLIDQVER